MSDSNVPPSPPPPPPPPPPAEGWGAPPSGAGGFSVGGALNYGWTKFQQNLGPIVLAALVLLAGAVIIQVFSSIVTDVLFGSSASQLEFNPDTGEFEGGASGGGIFGAAFFVSLLFGVVSFVFNLVIQAGIVNAALGITRGRSVDLKTMFNGIDYLQVFLAALIVGAATFVGLLLCIIPGLVVIFFTAFTNYFIIDKKLPAIEAIKASVAFVRQNVAPVLTLFLASIVVYIVGFCLCLVGLLAAIPVVIIAQAFAYRTLQGESVAA